MKYILFIALALLLYSCSTDDMPTPKWQSQFRNGLFVANEGNYTWNNASVSFIDLDSNMVYNDLFLQKNNRPLGDVVQSLYLVDTLLFIVVNNSSKIEIVGLHDLNSLGTIKELPSPRNMLNIGNNLALVTDLYSRYVYLINYQTFSLVDSIFLGKSSENLIRYQNKVFVTNWSKLGMPDIENNTVQVLNLDTRNVVDVIAVNYEPCGIQLDKNNSLWILCSGNYTLQNSGALIQVDPANHEVMYKFQFPEDQSPKNLFINAEKNELYYLNSHLFRMSISAKLLPTIPVIASNGSVFYYASISPFTNHIFVTDVLDYLQDGYIYEFSAEGEKINSFQVSVNPSNLLFVNTP